MKKNKLALWILSVLMISGLTSCYNDDGIRENIAILKQVSGSNFLTTEFEDVSGIRFVPNKPIMPSSNSELAWVHMKYNQNQIYSGSKVIDAEFLLDPVYIDNEPVDEYYPELEEATQNSVFNMDAKLWRKEFLVIAVDLFLDKDVAENDILNEIQNNHHFVLIYNPDEEVVNNTLKFQLRYELNSDLDADELKNRYTKRISDSRYFDIEDRFEAFKQINGQYPSRIEIEFYKSNYENANIIDDKWSKQSIYLEL